MCFTFPLVVLRLWVNLSRMKRTKKCRWLSRSRSTRMTKLEIGALRIMRDSCSSVVVACCQPCACINVPFQYQHQQLRETEKNVFLNYVIATSSNRYALQLCNSVHDSTHFKCKLVLYLVSDCHVPCINLLSTAYFVSLVRNRIVPFHWIPGIDSATNVDRQVYGTPYSGWSFSHPFEDDAQSDEQKKKCNNYYDLMVNNVNATPTHLLTLCRQRAFDERERAIPITVVITHVHTNDSENKTENQLFLVQTMCHSQTDRRRLSIWFNLLLVGVQPNDVRTINISPV